MAELLFYCQLIKAEHTRFNAFSATVSPRQRHGKNLFSTLHLCMKRGNASSKTHEKGNFAASRSGKNK